MSEVLVDLSPYEASLRERSSVLAGYVAIAGYHATPVNFANEVLQAADRANTVGTWEDGDPITEDDSLALASASVLSQMLTAYALRKHLKLEPWVEDQMPVYQEALTVMRKVGLFFDKSILDPELAHTTIGTVFGKDEAPNQATQIATDVWNARGSVPFTIDVYNKLPIAEDAPINDPEIDFAEVPFYLSFTKPRHATYWLSALLGDLLIIDKKLGPVGSQLPGERI